jgi:glycosyltransferase involved in cell wall biosynthesis
MQASWVKALKQLGHQVSVVRYTPNNHIRLNLAERVYWNVKVLTQVAFTRGKVDLIIFSLGADVLLPQTIQLVKSLTSSPLVILSGVSPITDGNPRERAMAKHIDLAATNDDSHSQQWQELGTKQAVTLPISAIDPELHYPRKVKRDLDVVFVGTLTPARRKFLTQLKKQLPEQISLTIKHQLWEENYAELMSRAKIVINPIRSEMKHGANLRLFEIPAFGALQLASSSHKQWLIPNKEVLTYQDPKQAAELIKKYLKDKKNRLKITERAQKRVLAEHTFKHRAKRLLQYPRLIPSGFG